ncbi:ADP-ribosylation factor-like protein 6-interacting protein 1 [Aedes albopictus]|uniref:Reticulon-like protein n=1 Tax=Aedes albopictus TaxID=7160 RepID=A0ABM1Z4M4_AEDAL|nr:ARL-6-interacting protein 1 homolog [Aedes albopictus]
MLETKKKDFNRLKSNLEDWRELLVIFHDLLQWKLPYSPVVIASSVTVFFSLLWWLNLTVVTQLALLLLAAFVGNFCYPSIAKIVFKPEKWAGVQEKHLDIVVGKMLDLSESVTGCWNSFFWNQHDKSVAHIVKVSAALLFMAWIGASVNNLLLCYLVSMTLGLWPGLSQMEEFQTKLDMIKSKISFFNTHDKTK